MSYRTEVATSPIHLLLSQLYHGDFEKCLTQIKLPSRTAYSSENLVAKNAAKAKAA